MPEYSAFYKSMKRIKYEEIQNSIQNYIKQRNLSTNSVISSHQILRNHKKLINSSPPTQNAQNMTENSNFSDLNLIALNDLVLIESSINDYYSYSFSSTSEQDYLKQFQVIKKFIERNTKTGNELSQFVYPLFIYMCIDLSFLGFTIQKLTDNYVNEMGSLTDSEKLLIENLKIFNETQDLTKCKLVDKWLKNKYQINLRESAWQKFMEFLRISKIHLFLRTINVHLQVIVNNHIESDNEEKEHILKNESNIQLVTNKVAIKLENIEIIDEDIKHINDSNTSVQENNSISLKSLEECIENIQDEPSVINGACCYYLNDSNDCITSANISPNTNLISFTNENSSIFLYQLNKEKRENEEEEEKVSKNSQNYEELVGGHSNCVFKSKFTHDSKYLLSCGADNVACLWDVNNISNMDNDNSMWLNKPRNVCTYSGHLYPVWDLEIYSRLNLFTTASKDSTARLWSFDQIYPLRIYCGHQSDVNCVQFHPNGAYLATGSSDKTVRLWSVQTGDFVRLFSGHRSRVFTVTFSPDGNYLASAGEDKKIKLWDLRSGVLFKEFKGHSDIVHSLCFDNNSEVLCSGGLDKNVKFWDVHRKNIKIGPDMSDGSSESKTIKNQNHSSELIKSINADFNIYSIYCDIQNVFYLTGAKKSEKINHQNVNSASNNVNNSTNNGSNSNQKKTNLKHEKFLKSEKKYEIPNQNFYSRNPTSNLSSSTINTRRRAAQVAANTNSRYLNNSSPYSTGTSSYLFSNNDDLYEA